MITRDDVVYEGAEALLFVGGRIGFGWITWLGWFPPLTWLLQRAYRFMATHRPLFARYLFRSETGGPFARKDGPKEPDP